MPNPMTPEEAGKKTCPLMSGPMGFAKCQETSCACWGWVDEEAGEIDGGTLDTVETAKGEMPEDVTGHTWLRVGHSNASNMVRWGSTSSWGLGGANVRPCLQSSKFRGATDAH